MNLNKKDTKINIIIRGDKKSRSFTIYNANIDEVYNKVYFMFEALNENKGVTHIKFYNEHSSS